MKGTHVDVAPVPLSVGRRPSQVLADYLALTKPRLNSLVVVTSAGGYYLGVSRPTLLPMAAVAIGTALVAGGAAVLNQVCGETDAHGADALSAADGVSPRRRTVQDAARSRSIVL